MDTCNKFIRRKTLKIKINYGVYLKGSGFKTFIKMTEANVTCNKFIWEDCCLKTLFLKCPRPIWSLPYLSHKGFRRACFLVVLYFLVIPTALLLTSFAVKTARRVLLSITSRSFSMGGWAVMLCVFRWWC